MIARLATVLLAAALLAGCQRAEANRADAVAARVNGTDILTLQGATPRLLEQAIDRELLVQEAQRAGLERDPKVARAIDEARREILARAWIERAGRGALPSADEVREFYQENRALFAGRRIYRLQELNVSMPANLLEALRAEAAHAGELEPIAAWLRARGLPFTRISLTQPAEEVPLRYLPQLARLEPGDVTVFATPPGAAVVRLLGVEEAPLTPAQAAPLIERFLAGRKRREIAALEARRLRSRAQIEYVGESGSNK